MSRKPVTGPSGDLDIRPVTPDRWPDLVELFERPGPRGSWPRTGACYCMFWRLPPAEYELAYRQQALDKISGGPNKLAMQDLVAGGTVPGLLAYRDGRPIGWVSVSPRSELVRLEHSPTLVSAEDPGDAHAWSISCFSVYRSEWRTGVGAALLAAAISRAVEHDASSVEAYPVRVGSIDPYTGYDTMFADAGFRSVKVGKGLGRSLWRRSLA